MLSVRTLAACAALGAVVSATSVAAAQVPGDEVRQLYQEGTRAFEVRDFQTALARFQQAYVLTRRPELLVNVGASFQQLGRRDDAIATYRQYLATMPDPPNRAEIEARIAQLQAMPAAAPVVTPPGGVVAPSAPLWPWVALGAGAALAVGGAVMLAVPGDPGADRSIATEGEYNRAVESRTMITTAGGVLVGVGAAVAAVGVVGLLLRPTPARVGLRVVGAPLAQGALLGVSGAF